MHLFAALISYMSFSRDMKKAEADILLKIIYHISDIISVTKKIVMRQHFQGICKCSGMNLFDVPITKYSRQLMWQLHRLCGVMFSFKTTLNKRCSKLSGNRIWIETENICVETVERTSKQTNSQECVLPKYQIWIPRSRKHVMLYYCVRLCACTPICHKCLREQNFSICWPELQCAFKPTNKQTNIATTINYNACA